MTGAPGGCVTPLKRVYVRAYQLVSRPILFFSSYVFLSVSVLSAALANRPKRAHNLAVWVCDTLFAV